MYRSWLQHQEHIQLVEKILKEEVSGTMSFCLASKLIKVNNLVKTWEKKLRPIDVRILQSTKVLHGITIDLARD